MDNGANKITLHTDDGDKLDLYVLEETTINGENYLFVSDSEEEDGACYLLKDKSKPEDAEAAYEFVDDDDEMEYLSKIFAELLGDTDVEIEK
ncbi:MAG: DUF1292 domain-containing protein [Clostridium sp.]